VSPNKPMQRAGTDKVHGRGRVSSVVEQVTSARVLNRQRAVADGGRYAALLSLVLAFGLLLVAIPNSHAEPPLKEIIVTPKNADSLDFIVRVRGPRDSGTLTILAPRSIRGDCLPTLTGAILKDGKGMILYEQSVSLATAKNGPEISGTLSEPTHTLKLWINYLCPSSHILDGARYVLSSASWQQSGGMR
jgi:hypothetical protein